MTPPTVTPGMRLGAYEILSSLGEGGMGAVYRARDTKLGREVAIKVLLPAVANDPERLARFQREAQVLASLNHPNIAHIYGIEESREGREGQEGQVGPFLVLELVEGATLADMLASGFRRQAPDAAPRPDSGSGPEPTAHSLKPHSSRGQGLPVDEALSIARQIAEALEAAHEQGIIHRDLKPANIKVRPDGAVKVLAFDATLFRAAVSVAKGTVAYRTEGGGRQLRWFDRSGKVLGTWGPPDQVGLRNPTLSPDGSRLAFGKSEDIWLFDGARTSRLTFGPSNEMIPVWSPDGARVVFQSDPKGIRNLHQHSTSGAGADVLLVESPQNKAANDWSKDGRYLLYNSADAQTGNDLWVRPMDGDPAPWVFLKTPFEERFGQFSPDDHWVAYMSTESGRFEVYIRPFSPASQSRDPSEPDPGRWPVSTAGGIYPRWRADGKELYYVGPSGEMMAVSVATKGATLTLGAPVALFQARMAGGGSDAANGWQYDVARDGRFLINTLVGDASAPITLVQNIRIESKK